MAAVSQRAWTAVRMGSHKRAIFGAGSCLKGSGVCAGQVTAARAAADDLRRRLEEAEAERDASRGDVDRLEAVLEQVPPRGAPLALSPRLGGQIFRA